MGYYLHSFHNDYNKAEYDADQIKQDTQNTVFVLEFFNVVPGQFRFAVVESFNNAIPEFITDEHFTEEVTYVRAARVVDEDSLTPTLKFKVQYVA